MAASPARLLIALAIASLPLFGCEDEATDPDGGARDGGAPADDGGTPPPVDGGVALVLDFTATGCQVLEQRPPNPDAGEARGLECSGPAPLAVAFVPISTTPLGQVLWDFGDGSAKSYELAPKHVYERPGQYDVTLVGGSASGAVSRVRAGFIVVRANPLGHSCDRDDQCAPSLTCICGTNSACGPAFARGICSTSCAAAACEAPAVCADLSAGGVATSAEPWRAPLCLAPCTNDSDCPSAWQRCRTLGGKTSAGVPTTWLGACFGDVPTSVGDACRGADGALHPETCVAGRCLDAGTYGLCTPDCRQTPCPTGFVCAVFDNDNRAGCLRPCEGSAGDRCSADPLLACEPPGWAGPKGFTAPALPADRTLCAPRLCTNDAECAPAGRCASVGGFGNCVRR